MRIAQIVCTYPPYHGGMGNAVYELGSGLADLGHYVEVITPEYFPEEELEEKKPEEAGSIQKQKNVEKELNVVANRLTPKLQHGNAAYIPQVQEELAGFDLVHLHYPFYGVANLVRKWKLQNPDKPLVITYHMDNRAPGVLGLYFKYYAKYWMPKILAVADIIITTSFDYIKSSRASELYLKNPKKWLELPLGVNCERFAVRPKQEALFRRHNLDINKKTILFVGGMDQAHHFKGVKVLLEALFLLKQNGTPVQAILVGDGENREQYELQVKGLGLEKTVKFAGQVGYDQLPYYYNLADLFVLPSINQSEAFGMVLLEAMASGVPVVASELPGVRTVAEDGGIVVKPNNPLALASAIVDFFNDKEVDMDKFRSNIRTVAEIKYSWESVVEKLDAIYQQLV